MNRLTLSIVGKTLFDADVESQAIEVGEALTGVMGTFWMMMLPFADVIERLPVPKLRRARMARVRLDAIIYRMIADRRASGRDHGDLLSMLLAAQDEDDGGVMTDQQVRDEAMTIFLAGHETTANALTWLWYLVGGAPDVEAKLHEEIDRVLQGRLPTLADVPSLPYVERVVTESMRLYPPAWIIGRRALDRLPGGRLRRAGAVDHHHEPVRHRSATRATTPTPSDSCPTAGRRSFAPRCRSSRTSRSAADRASASASRSRGWS